MRPQYCQRQNFGGQGERWHCRPSHPRSSRLSIQQITTSPRNRASLNFILDRGRVAAFGEYLSFPLKRSIGLACGTPQNFQRWVFPAPNLLQLLISNVYQHPNMNSDIEASMWSPAIYTTYRGLKLSKLLRMLRHSPLTRLGSYKCNVFVGIPV